MDTGRPPRQSIERVPYEARRSLFVMAMGIIAIVVVILGVISFFILLPRQTNSSEASTITQELSSLTQDLEKQLTEIRNAAAEVTEEVKQSAAIIEETQNPETAEALKEKIIQRQTEQWRTFASTEHGFMVKYPQHFSIATTANTTTPTLVTILYGGEPAVEIIRQESAEPSGTTSIEKENYFLILNDYLHTTTTELIVYTFKSL